MALRPDTYPILRRRQRYGSCFFVPVIYLVAEDRCGPHPGSISGSRLSLDAAVLRRPTLDALARSAPELCNAYLGVAQMSTFPRAAPVRSLRSGSTKWRVGSVEQSDDLLRCAG